MQTHIATTPFGRRPMTLGQISDQMLARNVPTQTTVHKWQVFQHIREARDALGASDRALAILNALLTFHPETALSTDGGGLIVWPSNQQLAARANGLSLATLRRHLANLVACGLIIRRDSPNGKRYARKGQGGEVERAFGFDLAPIVARAQEFKDLAVALQAERQALRVAREELTLCRRDVAKLIETGRAEGVPGDWSGFQRRYEAALARLPRTAPRQIVQATVDELDQLRAEIRNCLESFITTQNMNANESQSGRHIQNSNPESHPEIEQGFSSENEAGAIIAENDKVRRLPERELPLGIVLEACPNIVDFARDGEIRSWRDLLTVAEVVRTQVGVSPSAWEAAKGVLGPQHAAVTVAAIYQRADHIHNGGGYLRNLTERARNGKFSTWPMIMALLRAKLAEKAKAS